MARFVRRTESGEEYGATTLELFYDLVFVFAITQVTHYLYGHLTWEGAGQAALMLLVVWWSWQYTTWVTNELDPDDVPVRLLLIALMLASLLMSIAIPDAFGSKALLFAGSYVAIQVGRHAFLTFAAAERGTNERERSGRILTWFCAAGVFWIAGALSAGTLRTVLWLVALAVDYGGPLRLFPVPGRVRLAGSSWDIGTGHFAERFGAFVIIALGESIVTTGATTAELDLDGSVVLAFVLAFLGTAALWWLYFDSIARLAEGALARATDRGLMARDAYTYGHVLLIAGIIVSAVGDELVIARPSAELSTPQLIAVVAGPGIYLLAQAALRLRMEGGVSKRRVVGALACVAIGFVGTLVPAMVVGGLLLVALVGVVVADQLAGARRRPATRPG